MDIATQIKAARKRAKLSQAQASKKWGITKRSLQNWEQGVSTPGGLALLKLQEILAHQLRQQNKPTPSRSR